MRAIRLLPLLVLASAVLAGGGPETTLIVVNGASPLSRRVANEYMRLRDIPASHRVVLDSIPHLGVVSLGFFLDRIWKPIREEIRARGLKDSIDLIEYSADFPYAVDFHERLQGGASQVGRQASLTGVTYLIRQVEAEEPFWAPNANRYYRLGLRGGRKASRRATAAERSYALEASRALQQHRYGEAAKAFKALLATYDSAPYPWYNYACCLARLGRKREALAALKKASAAGFRDARHAAADPDLASLHGDPAFRTLLDSMGGGASFAIFPSHGFRSTDAWTGAKGDPGKEGAKYILATQLAYTGRYGNSYPEVMAYLRSAAGCDGSHPDGTVYICRNSNVRSTTREPFFAALAAGLKARGRKVAILEKGKEGQTGILPVGKEDVIGAVVGAASFAWGKTNSRFLPGAIAEHLTSLGAHFGTPGQTKLTEFLRYGAAGSSGTVQEPYALHYKFPNPLIHLFYADGCSLAEAFYESLWGPYQLMVVGDGLARPFATFVPVVVQAPPAPWKGAVQLSASAQGAGGIEIWVDGKRLLAGAPGAPLTLDTTKLADGHHEVRFVAVAGDAVQTRSYKKMDATFGNRGARAEVTRRGEFGLQVKGSGLQACRLLWGADEIASAQDGKLTVDPGRVGPGPVELRVLADCGGGLVWRSAPLRFDIAPSAPLPADPHAPAASAAPGLFGTATDSSGAVRPVAVTYLGDRRGGRILRDQLPAKGIAKLDLAGWIEVASDGDYQLALRGNGTISSLAVQGKNLMTARDLGQGQAYAALSLAAGRHPIRIRYLPKGRPDLELMLGGDQVYDAPRLWSASGDAAGRTPKTKPALWVDGKRGGKGAPVPKAGIILAYKRTLTKVVAITLWPGAGEKEFPKEWEVFVAPGYGGYKRVKDFSVVVAPSLKPRAKDKPDRPAYLRILFPKPLRAKKIRLKTKGAAVVAEVTVAVAPRKR